MTTDKENEVKEEADKLRGKDEKTVTHFSNNLTKAKRSKIVTFAMLKCHRNDDKKLKDDHVE